MTSLLRASGFPVDSPDDFALLQAQSACTIAGVVLLQVPGNASEGAFSKCSLSARVAHALWQSTNLCLWPVSDSAFVSMDATIAACENGTTKVPRKPFFNLPERLVATLLSTSCTHARSDSLAPITFKDVFDQWGHRSSTACFLLPFRFAMLLVRGALVTMSHPVLSQWRMRTRRGARNRGIPAEVVPLFGELLKTAGKKSDAAEVEGEGVLEKVPDKVDPTLLEIMANDLCSWRSAVVAIHPDQEERMKSHVEVLNGLVLRLGSAAATSDVVATRAIKCATMVRAFVIAFRLRDDRQLGSQVKNILDLVLGNDYYDYDFDLLRTTSTSTITGTWHYSD